MKKLTAGIFATLLAVVSADSAYAAIASSGYVDEKVGEVSQTVTTLSDTVSGHTTSIGEIKGTMETYGDIVTHNVAEFATAAEGDLANTAVQPDDITNVERTTNKTQTVNAQSTETQYPSAKAVWTAVSSVDANASVEALKGRVDTLEEASATHATKTELAGKQDKLSQTGSASQPVYVNAEGKVTAGNTIPTVTTSITTGQTAAAQAGAVATALAAKANTADLGALATLNAVGSTQITDGAVATADIADKAVTEAKLSDTVNASLDKADTALQQAALAPYQTKVAADAAYAVKTLEGQVGTVSAENMGTTATTVVTAIKEVAGKAAGAQSAVDAVEATIGRYGDIVTHNASEFATSAQGAKADTAVQPDAISDMLTKTEAGTTYYTKTSGDTLAGRVTTAEGEIDDIQAEMDTMATTETVTNLTDRVTTAEGDITALETAVNNDESGLAATNAIADQALANAATAQEAAEAAQTTANTKQDKLTGTIGGAMQPVYLNNGTITAGTALGTLATKSTVTNSEVADGALAQSKINGLATSLAAKLTTPPTSAKGESGLYVLTYDGTDFEWEDIARTAE